MSDFKHIQSAHCENGVTVSLLKHNGVDFLTEPLAFGIGAGLFYIHIPFLKVNNGPGISFRSMPGLVFNRTCKALGVPLERKKFRSEDAARKFLDQKIQQDIPVGCQVGVFNLPYFPQEYRFHFNAHNLVVFGKEGENYLISDPVMEGTTTLTDPELTKVRFAKGVLAPKGHIYFPKGEVAISDETIRKAIIKGINRNSRDMLFVPANFAGVSGINYTAKRIKQLRDKVGARKAGLFLGQVVRMQEEIGTGGGGFRFIYGAFLEQAAEILQDDRLIKASEGITKAGDMWRDSAFQMAGIYKGRLTEQKDFDHSAAIMNEIAAIEKETFKYLRSLNLK